MPDWALNEKQEDFLREVGNIGTGHALTSLSALAQVTLEMGLPTLHTARADQMARRFALAEGDYLGVKIEAREDLDFSVTMLMDKAFAQMLCLTLSGQAAGDFSALDDVSRSCLAEIGNILCNAFVNVVSTMFSLNLQTTEAAIKTGPRNEVLAALFGGDTERLFVDCEITCEGRERTIHLLFELDAAMTRKALALMEN